MDPRVELKGLNVLVCPVMTDCGLVSSYDITDCGLVSCYDITYCGLVSCYDIADCGLVSSYDIIAVVYCPVMTSPTVA